MGIQLRLYDIAGRLVRTLIDGAMPPGPHRIRWDGRSEAGLAVPSGVYLCQLTTQAGTKRLSVLVTR